MPRINLTVITIILLLVSSLSHAETDSAAWRKSMQIDFTTTQASYSDSWTGGEAGSVNWLTNLNSEVQKPLKTWFHFKSQLKLSFGQTLTQDQETKNWSKPRKSTDLIDWETVGRFTLDAVVDPYTAFRFESQFVNSANEAKKLYLTPMKFTESAGIAKGLYAKDKDRIITRLGFGLRQIMKTVIVDSLLGTVDSTLTDGGLESVTDLGLQLSERISLTSKLTLYKALFFSESDKVKGTPFENDWKAVDVNWENIVSASVARLVTVNLYAQLLYDKEVSRKGRIKETIAIGFVYKVW